MDHTEKEALKKWCPFIQKHCKGTECMLFEYAGEELRDTRGDTNTDSNKLKQPTSSPVYKCGVISSPAITADNMPIPVNLIDENQGE